MQLLAVYADSAEPRRLMKRWFFRRSRNLNDIEDLVEEVILRVLRASEAQEASIIEPQAYLYGICKHVLADYRTDIEAEAARVIVDSETVDNFGEDVIAENDRVEDRLNLSQQLEAAFSRLPPTHASVLLLHKRDGLSYEEVALQLNLSVFTVEKYITQAKARLRVMIWDR